MSFGIGNFPGISYDELNTWFFAVFTNSLDGIAFIGLDYKILYSNKQISTIPEGDAFIKNEYGFYFGYRVTLTRDGRETIEHYQKARETGEPFDAVIIDLTVPGGLGGVETIAILRQIDPPIKAIVSSGYANDPVMSEYEHYGFRGVVTKPYKFDELNEVLNRLLDKKQLSLDLTF